MSIFGKIFSAHWGPRMDDVLRSALLTLMGHAHPMLTMVPPLLTFAATLAFAPVAVALIQGQDSILMLLLYTLAFAAMKQRLPNLQLEGL